MKNYEPAIKQNHSNTEAFDKNCSIVFRLAKIEKGPNANGQASDTDKQKYKRSLFHKPKETFPNNAN